jgi:hypothetical protein
MSLRTCVKLSLEEMVSCGRRSVVSLDSYGFECEDGSIIQTNFLFIGLTAISMVPVDRIEAPASSHSCEHRCGRSPLTCSATADIAILAS